jgi:hypothetical protein
LKAADVEKDKITVYWHPPVKAADRDGDGYLDTYISQQPGSDGIAQLTINYPALGTYTLFVELRDDSARYGQGTSSGAGDGFSNLLQLTVKLPLSGNDGVTLLAQHPATLNVAQAEKLAAAGTSTAGFTAGATKDNGVTTSTTFKAGDIVTISGAVQSQIADVDKAASLFIVVVAPIGGKYIWLYCDVNGNYQPWSGAVADLKPALQTDHLKPSTTLDVYKGPVPAGTIQVFLGYKLTNSNTLHYSGSPLQLTIN